MSGSYRGKAALVRALVLSWVVGLVVGTACTDSEADKITAATLSEGCIINTDCEAPLVCAFRKCHTECDTSRDCPEGLRCVVSDRPFHVCQLADEQGCQYHSECPERMVCAVDRQCRDQCAGDRDCVTGQVCSGGTCAEPTELDADGALTPSAPDPGGPSGESCRYNSDCPGSQDCVGGTCTDQCVADRDCPLAWTCVESACVAPPPTDPTPPVEGTPCRYSSDCPEQQRCVTGICADECVADRDCEPGSLCRNGQCFASTDGGLGCAFNSDCVAPLVCNAGLCGPECVADRDCRAADRCQGGRCVSPTRADAGPSCVFNSDCTAPLVCNAGTCGPQCVASIDCQPGYLCVSGACVEDVAQRDCVFNSDCITLGTGTRCVLGQCVADCATDADCSQSESCQSGSCVYQAPPGAPPDYGATCNVSSDCPVGLVCGGNRRCVYECLGNFDCAPGYCCSSAFTCVTGLACEGPDAGPPPPPPYDAGGPCQSDFDCQDGVACNGNERCNGGVCEAATRLPCDDQNPCTIDVCVEPGSCTHTQTALPDADRDGHYDAACGGTADDCDDSRAEVYPGHPELCDQLDNNCNGVVDEGMWQMQTPVKLPAGASGETYARAADPNWSGDPISLAVSDSGDVYVTATADLPVAADLMSKIQGWKLTPTLTVQSGPTDAILPPTDFGSTGELARGGSVSTFGSKIAVSAMVYGKGSTDNFRVVVAVGDDYASLTEHIVGWRDAGSEVYPAYYAMWPQVTHDGTRFLAGFADTRDTGAPRAHVGTVPTGGAAATTSLVVSDAAVATSYRTPNYTYPVRTVAQPGRGYVAWSQADARPRVAAYDPATRSTLAGEVALTNALSQGLIGSLSLRENGNVVLSQAHYGNQDIYLAELDPTTLAIQEERTLSYTYGVIGERILPIAGGLLFVYRSGREYHYAWNEGISQPFTESVHLLPSTGSDPAVARVDDDTAVVAWTDGTDAWVALIQCGG